MLPESDDDEKEKARKTAMAGKKGPSRKTGKGLNPEDLLGDGEGEDDEDVMADLEDLEALNAGA